MEEDLENLELVEDRESVYELIDGVREYGLRKLTGWFSMLEDRELSKMVRDLFPRGMRVLIPASRRPNGSKRCVFTWFYPVWDDVPLFNPRNNLPSRPPLLYQQKSPHCLAYAMWHTMTFQCIIIAKFTGITVIPKVSIHHLIEFVKHESGRKFKAFSRALVRTGVFKHSDYDKERKRSNYYATTFFHFEDPPIIFTQEGLTTSQYGLLLAYCVTRFVSAILHVVFVEGKSSEVLVGEEMVESEDKRELRHHAVSCVSWTFKEDSFVFECIDSANKKGKTVFIRDVNTIKEVLVMQLLDFTKFLDAGNVPANKKKNRRVLADHEAERFWHDLE